MEYNRIQDNIPIKNNEQWVKNKQHKNQCNFSSMLSFPIFNDEKNNLRLQAWKDQKR